MSEELKPCPFCGGEDLDTVISNEDREGIPTNIVCISCGGQSGMCYTPEGRITNELINVWNRRIV